MADVKWSDNSKFLIRTVVNGTDYVTGLQSGQNSKWQWQTIFDKIITIPNLSPAELVYVSSTGNDTTGNGSISNPYATVRKAASVTSGTTLLPKTILVSSSLDSPSNDVMLPANVNIIGAAENVVINASINMAAANGSSSVLCNLIFNYLNVATGSSASEPVFYISNCTIRNYALFGSSSQHITVYLDSCNFGNNINSNSFDNCTAYSKSCMYKDTMVAIAQNARFVQTKFYSEGDSFINSTLFSTYQDSVSFIRDALIDNCDIALRNSSQTYLITSQVSDLTITAANTSVINTDTLSYVAASLSNSAVQNLVGVPNLQQVYDVGALIQLDVNPLLVLGSSGDQLSTTSEEGTQAHAPLYFIGGSYNIAQTDIDKIFINSDSVPSGLYVALETGGFLYAQNSSFYAFAINSPTMTVVFPAGVTLDGVDAANFILRQNDYIHFIRTAQNTWVSDQGFTKDKVFNSMIAGSGISIAQDGNGNSIFSLSGTGASTAYGFLSVQNLSAQIAFTDNTTWMPITGGFLYSSVNNFSVGNDSLNGPFYLQYLGSEAGVFQITVSFSLQRFSSNTACGYWLSAGLNNSTPINSGKDQLSFCLDGTGFVGFRNAQVVTYTIQVPLTTGQKIYYLLQNAGSTSSVDNDVMPRQTLFTIHKIGDIGGSTSGVTSLNGLTGDLEIAAGNKALVTLPDSTTIKIDYTGEISGNLTFVDTTGAVYNLTNPCPRQFNYTPNGSGQSVVLPPVLVSEAVNLLNVGDVITIINNNQTFPFDIKTNDGTYLCTCRPWQIQTLILQDNSTAAGTWYFSESPKNIPIIIDSSSVQVMPNIKYILRNGSLTSVFLPASNGDDVVVNEGDWFSFYNFGAGGFKIFQSGNGAFTHGDQITWLSGPAATRGAAGYVQTTQNNSCIEITCAKFIAGGTADDNDFDFIVTNSQGSFNFV